LLIDNQKFDTNSKHFLNKICEYFATIGASMSKQYSEIDNSSLKIYSKRCITSFAFHEIREASHCISNIKMYSAHEPDEILSKFVKLANKILTPILTKLYNKCIQLKTFPDLKFRLQKPLVTSDQFLYSQHSRNCLKIN